METKENIYIHAITRAICDLNYCQLVGGFGIENDEEKLRKINNQIKKTIDYLIEFIPEEENIEEN